MSLKLYAICALSCILLELCAHVAISHKQTQIESRAAESIVKNNQRVSSQRHQGSNSIENVLVSVFVKNCARLHFLYSNVYVTNF